MQFLKTYFLKLHLLKSQFQIDSYSILVEGTLNKPLFIRQSHYMKLRYLRWVGVLRYKIKKHVEASRARQNCRLTS